MINNGQAAFFTSAEKLSQKRIEYKARTGLSNEQIEGWYIMYKRNVKKNLVNRFLKKILQIAQEDCNRSYL